MKKIAVLLANGFEEIEALTVVDILRRANVDCKMVSINDIEVQGSHKISVKADCLLSEEIKNYDMVVLPGGMPGVANLRDNEQVIEIIQSMYKKGKKLAAICAAPIVLEKAGLIKEKNVTSYPNALERENEVNYKEDKVVIDENIITSRGPATAMEFSYTILRELDYEDEAINLEKGMLYKIR